MLDAFSKKDIANMRALLLVVSGSGLTLTGLVEILDRKITKDTTGQPCPGCKQARKIILSCGREEWKCLANGGGCDGK